MIPQDYLGKEIKIGDHVIYNRPKFENFGRGEVIDMWNKDKFGRDYECWYVSILGLRNQKVTRISTEILVINELI